ncbi:MAG: fibronectin type III domain-containing protein [Cryobacterium sp.]|nr:fibronectin type III domain-containing protein [Cryobacterium sp.]
MTTQAAIGDVFTSVSLSQSSNPLTGQLVSPVASSSTVPSSGFGATSKNGSADKFSVVKRELPGVFTPTVSGVAVLSQPALRAGDLAASFNASLTFSKKVEFGDAQGAFATVDVNVVPSIGVDLDVHRNAVGVPNGMGLAMRSTVKVAVSAEAGIQGKWTKELGVIRGSSIIFTIGPVPVVIVPKMPVDLEISGSVSIKTELSMQVGAELSYDTRDDRLRLTNLSKGPRFGGGVLGIASVSGQGAVLLKPRPGLAFYDVFGPALLPSLELRAEVNPLPDPGDAYFTLSFQLVLSGGMTLDILGKHAELKIQLAVFPFPKFEVKSPPVGLILTPDTSKVEAGQSRQFTAARSDGQAPSGLVWRVRGGVAGDRIDNTGLLTPAMPAGRVLHVIATDASRASGQAVVAVGDGFEAPVGITASQTYGTTSVALNWSPPAQSAGSPISSYRITGGPNGPVSVSATARSFAFESLRPTYYSFSVYAINTLGRVSPPASASLLVRPICTERASSGAWTDPATWSTGTVPGPQSWVCIDGGNVTLPGAPLAVQGIQLSGGTLTAPSRLTVTSSAVLAGTINGGGEVVVQPGVDVEASGLVVGDSRLVKKGTMRFSDS